MEDCNSPTQIGKSEALYRSSSTASTIALNRLSSLHEKIYQGEYSPRNIPLITEPSLDSKTALKVAISTSFFMLGLHLKQQELYSLILLKLSWLLAVFSYFYLFPPKTLKCLQKQLSCFIVFRLFSSSIVYSFVTGQSFSYEFHIHSQDYDILVNLFLVLIIALLVQKEVKILTKYLLSQFLSYIFISGALQVWFSIFDYIALLRQIVLFVSFVTYSKLILTKSSMDRELLKATVSKHCEDISQELNEIKNKLEEEIRAMPSNSLNTSKVDELVMKVKYFKFALLQKEKEKSFLNVRPVFTSARRKTYISKGAEPLGPYAERRIEESLVSSGILPDLKTSNSACSGNCKNDMNSKWTLSSSDCDNLVKLILEKQVFLWYPEVLKTKDSRVCKESAEFLKQHFTEIGNSLFRTNTTELKQSLSAEAKTFGNSPWSNYLDTNICSWNFDMLKFKELTNGNHLPEFGSAMIKKFDILKTLNTSPSTMTSFLQDVSDAYLPNAYHNSIHGADVCNSVGYFLVHQEFGSHFNELESACLIISALVHDLGHPGLNNAFLVNTQSTEALIYNDQSVLENFHTASFFKVLQKSSSNILENLSEKDYKQFRKLAISLILDTDLTKHFIILSKFRNNPDALNFAEENDRFLTLSIALKCADVAHGAKELNLHKRWSRRIIEEFFYQGDKEKEYNIPVSPLCDRTGNISKSQHGFLNFIVLPLFEAIDQKLFSEEMRETVTNQIRKNIQYWEEEIPKEIEGQGKFMIETEKILEDITQEAATGK